MKAVLEFRLPEERDEYHAMLFAAERATERADILFRIYEISRSELKHGENTVESLRKALEEVRSLALE